MQPHEHTVAFLENLQGAYYRERYGVTFPTVLLKEREALHHRIRQQDKTFGIDFSQLNVPKADSLLRRLFGRGMHTSVDRHTHLSGLYENYSKYEHPAFIGIIDRTKANVQPALSKLAQRAAQKRVASANINDVVFGTLPDATFNAMALRAPTGNFIIVFNHGLISLLSRMAKLITFLQVSIPISEYEAINFNHSTWGAKFQTLVEHAIERNPEIVNQFLAVVANYFELKVEAKFRNEFFKPEVRLLAEYMTVGAEMFVLAHEGAHVLCGHLNASDTSALLTAAQPPKLWPG